MVTLSSLPEGARGRVVSVLGGWGVMRRLMQMGLTPGTVVEVVRNSRGPVLIRVRGVVIALGRGMAAKVVVEPV